MASRTGTSREPGSGKPVARPHERGRWMKAAVDRAREAPSSTKARLLAAAEEVFAARGFEGASTREIAARAGVNISSLHYHWSTKETLYLAVLRHVYERMLELVRGTIPALLAGPTAPREGVALAMGRLFDFLAEHPNIPRLLVRHILDDVETDPEVQREVMVPAFELFARWTGLAGSRLGERELKLFMLSAHSALLLLLLDSRDYRSVLGGSVRSPELLAALREHIVGMVTDLLLGPAVLSSKGG